MKFDEEDLRQLQSGNKRVYREIYQQYHKRLYGLAFKYLKSRELAKDAVQDVFVKLWENRQSVESNIKSYLFTSLRNHVLNMIRNHNTKVKKHATLEQEEKRTGGAADEELIYEEYKEILLKGLQELPAGKREIFELKTIHGMSNKDIVIKLDITINTVKSQYYEASKFIKNYLHEHADIKKSS